MPAQLVEVEFKGNRRAFYSWAEPEPLAPHEAVIVESDRGLDWGRVSATGPVASLKCARCQARARSGDEREAEEASAAALVPEQSRAGGATAVAVTGQPESGATTPEADQPRADGAPAASANEQPETGAVAPRSEEDRAGGAAAAAVTDQPGSGAAAESGPVPTASGPQVAPAAPERRVVRRATAADTRIAEELRRTEDDVRRRVREKVVAHRLQMKVSDAEWQWDRNRLTVYFTAERRVDFRNLVRDLASQFRTRIELRQIGVRDESKRLDGIGRCGRQLCCTWLPELRPIGLQIAKDQRLSLNPTQISGACGRLLCCLRYEHEFYVQSRKRFPKEGKVLVTAKGNEKVVSVDIFRERVTLRAEDATTRTVPLADLKHEVEGMPAPAAEPAPAPEAPPAPPQPGGQRRGRRGGRRRRRSR